WSAWSGRSYAQDVPPPIEPLGSDAGSAVDRYRVTLQPGGTLWDIAQEHLPLVALEQGDQAAADIIIRSFSATFPDRPITAVHPGDSFVLEVPSGSFVTRRSETTAQGTRYEAFNGDRLLRPLDQPNIIYRLTRADQPDTAEVLVAGADADPVELAKTV